MGLTLPRNAQIWLPGLLAWRWRTRGARPVRRVLLTIADHFEPFWHRAEEATARERVSLWRRRWPEIAARHHDSAGNPPCYTFFYPQEEYRPFLLDPLAEMVQSGIADVEVHIHHDGEGERDFLERMSGFIESLHQRHGLLRRQGGKLAFGFIHGNWALDNSRPDGRWCGLNNEISLLRGLGCYADFTMPSAPSPTQARLVNTIYWATDDPARPKSYDSGRPVAPGNGRRGDLLMVPGPLALNWKRPGRLVPAVETGELACYAQPSVQRVRLWLDHAPRIGDTLFLKLFTHGAQEKNSAVLLAGGLDSLYTLIKAECDSRGVGLYWASACRMAEAILALQQEGTLPAPGQTQAVMGGNYRE